MNLISYILQSRRSPSKPERLKKHPRSGQAAMEISSPLLQHQQIQNASCTLNLVAVIWLGLKDTPTSDHKSQINSSCAYAEM